MPKKVDHNKRKLEILDAAVKVFGQKGFENSNLSIIAQESNLSRATIYQYFKNKDEVYYYAIKQSTENMFEKYTSEILNTGANPVDEIQTMVNDINNTALIHKKELSNLIKAIGKIPGNLDEMIYRRTGRLQLLLRKKIRNGIKNNQIKDIDSIAFTKELIILIESFCFQMAYFSEESTQQTQMLITKFIDSIRKK